MTDFVLLFCAFSPHLLKLCSFYLNIVAWIKMVVFWMQETNEFGYFCCWPQPDGRITSPPPPPPHTPSAEMLAHTHLHTADSLMHHKWSYQWSYRCTTYWPTACNSKKTQSSPDINQRSLTLCHCPSIEVQRSVQLINMAIYKQNYISNRAIYEFNYKLLSSVV